LDGVLVFFDGSEEQLVRVPADIVDTTFMAFVGELSQIASTRSSSVPPKSLGISKPTLIRSHILTFLSREPLAKMLLLTVDH
jgi:hypothetical protein